MENIEKLFELPTPGQGCHGVNVFASAGLIHAVFAWFEGGKLVYGALTFQGVIAYKYADEPVSFELAETPSAYDSVVEVSKSDWAIAHIESYKLPCPKDWKHLCVYFSNAGLLNVLCKGVEMNPSVESNDIISIVKNDLQGGE